jgi:hypothetical protein
VLGVGQVEHRTHPFGYAGITVETVKEMVRQVLAHRHHPLIRERVIDLFRGLAPMDYSAEIAAVWSWVLGSIRYLREKGEHITGPLELEVRTWSGRAMEDCESIAAYAATLFDNAGFDVLFELQGYGDDPRDFSHVALLVLDPAQGRWVSFDPVAATYFDDFGLGDSVVGRNADTHVELWGLDGEVTHMDGFGECALGDVGSSATDIADAILGTVGKVAPIFGPAGMIVGGLATTAEGIVDVATGKPAVLIPMKKAAAAPSSGAGPAIAVGVGLALAAALL